MKKKKRDKEHLKTQCSKAVQYISEYKKEQLA